MYASRAAFSRHEILEHSLIIPNPDPSVNVDPQCLFCNEDIGSNRTKRARHVGRHMEEIAFAIVTKPYEEWDFYSGSTEEYHDRSGLLIAASWPSAPSWYPCICHDCGHKLYTVADRAKHFVSIHGLSIAAARAQFGGGYQCRCSNTPEEIHCNTIFSSSMDLGTHVFIFHTTRRRYFCEQCNRCNPILRTCSMTRRMTPYNLAPEQRQCGLCGQFPPEDELFEFDRA